MIVHGVEIDCEGERWDMEAYDAVCAGVPTYVAALTSTDPALRLWASYLLAWFPEDRGTIVPALIRVIRDDQEPVVVQSLKSGKGGVVLALMGEDAPPF